MHDPNNVSSVLNVTVHDLTRQSTSVACAVIFGRLVGVCDGVGQVNDTLLLTAVGQFRKEAFSLSVWKETGKKL